RMLKQLKPREATFKPSAREPMNFQRAAMRPGVFATSAVGNLPMQRALSPFGVQAKLTTSQPGDPDEQEADRLAERVAASPTPISTVATCPTCDASGTTCPKCEEEKRVQRKTLPGAAHSPPTYLPGLRGPGHPLSRSVRAFFEPHFDRDLSAVRIHTDEPA